MSALSLIGPCKDNRLQSWDSRLYTEWNNGDEILNVFFYISLIKIHKWGNALFAMGSLQWDLCNGISAMGSLQWDPCNGISAMGSLQCVLCNGISAIKQKKYCGTGRPDFIMDFMKFFSLGLFSILGIEVNYS